MAASGHGMVLPDMRTFAQKKARLRSPRERRGIMSAHADIIPWPQAAMAAPADAQRIYAASAETALCAV